MARHRFSVPALLVTAVYVVALAIAAVVTVAAGDIRALWYLTLFKEAEQGIAVTWPNVLVLVMAGALWAWTLLQILRGPLAGPAPGLDRDARRLRAALYAATAIGLVRSLVPSWPWWTTVPNDVALCVAMMLFRPVLGRDLGRFHQAGIAGVLVYGGFGGAAVIEVLAAFDQYVPVEVALILSLAGLTWMVLVLRGQRRDDRWQPATALYGTAALVVPFVSVLAGPLLAIAGNVYVDATAATGALMTIWLARSAHELADPPPQQTPPLLARQPEA